MGARNQKGNSKIYLFILLTAFAICFLIPITAPIIGIALILWGREIRRDTKHADLRTIAAAAIVGGIVLLFIGILIIFSMPINFTSSNFEGS